jgi:hypothetical protein
MVAVTAKLRMHLTSYSDLTCLRQHVMWGVSYSKR